MKHNSSGVHTGDLILFQVSLGKYQAAFITNIHNPGVSTLLADDGRRAPSPRLARLDPATNLPFTDEALRFGDASGRLDASGRRIDPATNLPITSDALRNADATGRLGSNIDGAEGRNIDPATNLPFTSDPSGQRLDASGRLDPSGRTDASGRLDPSGRTDASGRLDPSGRLGSNLDPNTNRPFTGQVDSDGFRLDDNGRRIDSDTNLPYIDQGRAQHRADAQIIDLCVLEPTGTWRPVLGVKRGHQVSQWCLTTECSYEDEHQIDPVTGLHISQPRTPHDSNTVMHRHRMDGDRLDASGQRLDASGRFDAAGRRLEPNTVDTDPNTNLPIDRRPGMPAVLASEEAARKAEADRVAKLPPGQR